jgi:osmotically-inducible protein OsmY
MKHLLTLVAAAAGAAATMYYFDPDMGRRRRALLRDRLVHLTHEAERGLRGEVRYATDVAYGVYATGHLDRESERLPATDGQLRDRVRSRLGHLVSHPGAIDVTVQDGVVRLSGGVLAQEQDGLLLRVRDMAGVQRVINALDAYQSPQQLAAGARRANVEEEDLVAGHPT